MSLRLELGHFNQICYSLLHNFVHRSRVVAPPRWQGVDISGRSEMVTRELLDVTVGIDIPPFADLLAELVKPNLPWAEDHFLERVSGIPHNPPPSHEWWPFAQKSNDEFREQGQFSHTYPERFWPKHANHKACNDYCGPTHGIRYAYGDLNDVVVQLRDDRLTRQAFLPVWFPEDTGAVEGQRVPCTLGYHFIERGGKLHCIYYIRSCDFRRHFRDDVYMAARLTQWVSGQIGSQLGQDLPPGRLTMHITSFHVFEGDMPALRSQLETHNNP